MCDVWKTRSPHDLTPEELHRVLSNRLFSRVRHAGISGGEPSLRKDLPQCLDAILDTLPRLRSLSITTHGFQWRRWADFLPRFQQRCAAHGVAFRLNCSLDGVGPVHDQIRGIPGAFDRTLKTWQLATDCAVPTQLQATISRDNVYHVNALLAYAEDADAELIFRQATRIERLDNAQSVEQVALDDSESSFFADFLASARLRGATGNPARRLFYRDLSHRLRTGAPRTAPCHFQNEGVVLDEAGDLYHCSISTQQIGNARVDDAEALYFSEHSQRVRRELIARTCPGCIHDQSGAWPPGKLMDEVLRARPIGRVLERIPQAARFGVGLLCAGLSRAPRVGVSDDDLEPSSGEDVAEERPVVFEHALAIGAYGGEHVGDAAILGGVAMRLHERWGIRRLTILSTRPERTRHWVSGLVLPVDVGVRSLHDMGAEATMRPGESSILVWAGGPIMDSPPVLLGNLRVAQRAAIRGVGLALEGVGLGPWRGTLSRQLARAIIRRAGSIRVRDADAAADPLLRGRAVTVQDDPAFDYLATRREPTRLRSAEQRALNLALPAMDAGVLTIGLNLRPLWRKYFSCTARQARGRYNAFLDQLARGCRQIAERHVDFKPAFVFFAMNADHYGFSDLSIAEDLRRRLDPAVWYRVVECELGVDAVLTLIRRCHLVLAMRYHAVIFGLSQGRPTLGFDYQLGGSGKVARLMTDRGLNDALTSIDTMTPDWLVGHAGRVAASLDRPPSSIGLPVVGGVAT